MTHIFQYCKNSTGCKTRFFLSLRYFIFWKRSMLRFWASFRSSDRYIQKNWKYPIIGQNYTNFVNFRRLMITIISVLDFFTTLFLQNIILLILWHGMKQIPQDKSTDNSEFGKKHMRQNTIHFLTICFSERYDRNRRVGKTLPIADDANYS